MKIIISIIIAILVIGIGFFLYRAFISAPPGNTPPPPANYETLLPVAPSTTPPPIPTGNYIILTTPKGNITTTNFLKNADDLGDGIYVLAMTDDYHITYSRWDNGFQIALLTRPVQSTRQKAEGGLLNILGVSDKNDACNLLINVSVPFDVDPALSGRELGLSFCPDGVAF